MEHAGLVKANKNAQYQPDRCLHGSVCGLQCFSCCRFVVSVTLVSWRFGIFVQWADWYTHIPLWVLIYQHSRCNSSTFERILHIVAEINQSSASISLLPPSRISLQTTSLKWVGFINLRLTNPFQSHTNCIVSCWQPFSTTVLYQANLLLLSSVCISIRAVKVDAINVKNF